MKRVRDVFFFTRSLLLASEAIQIKNVVVASRLIDLDLSFFWGNVACKAAGKVKGGDKIREKKTKSGSS